MNQQDLTPVTVFTVIAANVFGLQMALVIGPYIVIGIGAMGGAAIALLQGEPRGNLRAFVYFTAMAAFAVLLTVPISMAVSAYFDAIKESWLFAPISFGLGYCGNKWASILNWCGAKINALIDALIQARGSK